MKADSNSFRYDDLVPGDTFVKRGSKEEFFIVVSIRHNSTGWGTPLLVVGVLYHSQREHTVLSEYRSAPSAHFAHRDIWEIVRTT